MKTLLLSALLVFTAQISMGQAAVELDVDPATSRVLWTATKVTGEHSGQVPVQGGVINIGGGRMVGAVITLDMANLTCIDVEDEGSNAKLVRHLKGADFFDVENHGTAHFVSTSVEPIAGAKPGQMNYRVNGDLTIKGVTVPNTFDCLFYMKDATGHAAATVVFDRTKYGVTYGSGTIFTDLADKAISDDVTVTFDVTGR